MASVRKLDPTDKKSPWVVEYTDVSGKRRRKTPKSGLREDAKELARKIENELAEGAHTADKDTITVKQACDNYLALCERRFREKDGIARTTLTNRRLISAKHIVPFIGAVKLNRLTAPMMQRFVDDLRWHSEDPRGASIMDHILQVFRQTLGEAQRQGYVARNVLKEAPPRVAKRDRGTVQMPSKDIVRRLLGVGREQKHPKAMASVARAGLACEIAVFTGMREGEIFALRWSDIDFDARLIRVRHSVNRWLELGPPKSKAGVRDLPLPPGLALRLREWKVATPRHPKDWVLSTRGGQPLSVANFHATEWRRIVELSDMGRCDDGSRFHFHALRHFAASLFIEQGLPPKRVQYLMGHTSIQMTFDRYGHLFPDDGAAHTAAAAMEQQF